MQLSRVPNPIARVVVVVPSGRPRAFGIPPPRVAFARFRRLRVARGVARRHVAPTTHRRRARASDCRSGARHHRTHAFHSFSFTSFILARHVTFG